MASALTLPFSVDGDMAAIFVRGRYAPSVANARHDGQATTIVRKSHRRSLAPAALLLVPFVAIGIAVPTLMMARPDASPAQATQRPAPVAPRRMGEAMPAPVQPAPMQPAPVLVAQASPPVPASSSGTPAVARRSARQARRSGFVRSVCARSSAACVRAEELAADRRLRDAYAAAVAAGAPRGDLAEFRAAWADIRRTSADRPHDLAASYTVMARQLRWLAQETRDDRY